MSVRSFKRERARRERRESRRLALLQRKGLLATGAALGASAVFATSAQAASYVVNTTADDAPGGTCSPSPGTCTLRDALTAANADTSADTITFASSVTGAITLSNGALPVDGSGGVTIQGPGASILTISGGHASQIFDDTSGTNVADAISGLTLTDGSTSSPGGAIDQAEDSSLTLTDDVISGSTTTSTNGGGGVYSDGSLTLSGTTINGDNNASDGNGGGISIGYERSLTTSDSTISGNTAADSGGGIGARGKGEDGDESTIDLESGTSITDNHAGSDGGGVYGTFDSLTMDGTTVSGNTAGSLGGGIEDNTKLGVTITGSTISGNSAATGGGIQWSEPDVKYGGGGSPLRIDTTTISGNQTTGDGAGIEVAATYEGDPATIKASTITGNHAGSGSFGGGIDFSGGISAPVDVVDSTIAANSAATGGAVSFGDGNHDQLFSDSSNADGAISLDDSTVASNSSTNTGGGLYLGEYSAGSPAAEHSGTVTISGTDVSGNNVNGVGQDLDRPPSSTSGGFDGSFSLIQQPGSAPLTQQSVITGQDPQLSALANNGGPTETMLPGPTSPLIDQGRAEAGLTTDQRGDPRTVQASVPDPPGGDGTDIGSVELPANAVAGVFGVSIRGSLLGGPQRLLVAGTSTPATCSVRVGTISNCVIKVRTSNNTLIADGSATTAYQKQSLAVRIRPTKAGYSLLAHHPLGIEGTATAVGGLPGSPTASGRVRVLAGPFFAFRTGNRSPKLTAAVRSDLRAAASLLSGVKTVTCKAYTNKGKHDAALTKAQAKAACTLLRRDKLKAKYSSFGMGVSRPGVPSAIYPSNRLLVIRFTF
jgi:CSLREA domain-containing protein